MEAKKTLKYDDVKSKIKKLQPLSPKHDNTALNKSTIILSADYFVESHFKYIDEQQRIYKEKGKFNKRITNTFLQRLNSFLTIIEEN